MAQYITRIRTAAGDLQIDYNSLANLPQADTNVEEAVSDAIEALNLPETYASKTHEHKIEDITGLNDTISAIQDSISNIQDSASNTLVVTADMSTNTADYNATQIAAHLNNGGDVLFKTSTGVYAELQGVTGDAVFFKAFEVSSTKTTQYTYSIWADGSLAVSEKSMEAGSGTGMTEEQVEQLEANTEAIQANTEAIADMNRQITGGSIVKSDKTITMTLTRDGGNEEVHVVTLNDNGYPIQITVNGNEANFEWSGFDGT